MEANRKVSDKEILEALTRNGGLIKMTADALGITRQALWSRFKNNPDLEEAKAQIREGNLDLAESQLLKKVKRGEWLAVKYILSCLGKHRGYVERRENALTDQDGEPLTINISLTPAESLVKSIQEEQRGEDNEGSEGGENA
jgi:hypothetical protein